MRHKALLVGAVAAMAAGIFLSFRAVGVETVAIGLPAPAEAETPAVVEATPVALRPTPSANPRLRERRAPAFRPPAVRGVRPGRSASTRLAPRPRATLPAPRLRTSAPKPLRVSIPAAKRAKATKATKAAPAPIPAPAPPEETAATLISASSPPAGSRTAADTSRNDAGPGDSAKPRAEAKPTSGGTTTSMDDAMPDLDGDAKKKKNKPQAHAKAKTPQASGGEAGGGEPSDVDDDRGRGKKGKAKHQETKSEPARADEHGDRDDKHDGEGDRSGDGEHGKNKGKDKKDRGDGAADE